MIKYPLNVTIDSNIFDASNYDLGEKSTLSHLISYVEKGKIKVFMSNIVVNEISKHIKNRAYEIRAIINNSRKELRGKYPESLIKSVDMGHLLKKTDRDEMALKAHSSLNEFLKKLDVTYLDNSGVDVGQYYHYIGSFHMYDYHFERVQKMVDNYEPQTLSSSLSVDISKACFDKELEILFKKEAYSRATGEPDENYTLNSSWLKYIDTLFTAHNNWKKFKNIQSAEEILASLEPSDLLDAAHDFLMRQNAKLVTEGESI